MQPAYPSVQIRYNDYSPKAKELLKEWEAQKGIKEEEMLSFEMIGNGDNALVAHKGTHDGDMAEAWRTKPLSPQGTINGESIVDPGTGDAIQILYFTGMYSPNVPKKVIMFMPIDVAPDGSKGRTVLRIPPFSKKSNPELYRYLVMSNYLEDNANPAQVTPPAGYLYRLIRPVEVVEQGWEQRMALSNVLQEINVATRATLLNLAPKLKGVAHQEGITDNQLRENFARFAEKGVNYQQVATLFAADETKFTTNVEKAIEQSIVAVDKDRAVWVFTSNPAAVICQASPTESTTQQLVNFLLVENGQTTYKQLLALLAKKK